MNEHSYHTIVSGKAQGIRATVLRALLRVLSLVYALGVNLRLWLFKLGLRGQEQVALPIICVGNLSLGGSGKTPMVALICQHLLASGKKPAILSRGYGTDQGQPNDEAHLLEEILPEVAHIQNPKRVQAAKAIAQSHADIIVMDDGFSHLQLKRDADILLFDALCPFGYDALFPRGLLREPLRSTKRAQLAVITRCDAVDTQTLTTIQERLIKLGLTKDQILHATHAPKEVRTLSQEHTTIPREKLKDTPVALMSAIGNHQGFAHTITSLGAKLVYEEILPDHFAYDDDWLSDQWPQVVDKAIKAGTRFLIVTQKDAVKVRGRLKAPEQLTLLELHISMHLREGDDTITRLLQDVLARHE